MPNISIKNFDWTLFVSAVVLSLIGLTVIYSVVLSGETAEYSLLIRQAIFFVIGIFLLFAFAFFDYRVIGSISRILYFFSIFLLIFVLIFGSIVRGTRGWFDIFGLSFQPVEIAKLSLIFFLASFFSNRTHEQASFKNILKSFLWAILPIVLILFQPDLGSALILIAIWFLMLWFSGLTKKQFFVILVLVAIAFSLFWFFISRDYQKERILNFLNPNRDPLGNGYNVRQSIISVGSGQIIGRGLGFGPQSQLRFLPETSADFIFGSLSEELGFLGAGITIFLYILFFWRIYKATKFARDNFSAFLILGIGSLFFLQTAINIGMSVGMLPVTGLPLPFISSGGSFLIISLVSVGIMESAVMRNKGVI
jgi:rod shape determining protein RodA